VLLGAAGAIVVVAAAVVLALVLTRGSSDSTATPTPLPDSQTAVSLFRGIPQHGNILGSATAPVTMIEYIDLQCSSCRVFETDVMPSIVPKYVRTGKVKVEARSIVLIGDDSERGARAVIAAGKQNRFFTLAQVMYYNQGPENGGWLSDETVADAASGVPGLDLPAFLRAFRSSAVGAEVKRFDAQASADNVSGTPTVYVSAQGGPRQEVAPGFIPSAAQLSAAVDKALRQ
jgi:protein-disulfide isomerase